MAIFQIGSQKHWNWPDLHVEAILEEMLGTVELASIRRWIWYGWIFMRFKFVNGQISRNGKTISNVLPFGQNWKWRKSIGVFCVGKFRRFWGVPFRRIFEFSKVKVLFWGKWISIKWRHLMNYSNWPDLDVEAILEQMLGTVELASIRRWIWYEWFFMKFKIVNGHFWGPDLFKTKECFTTEFFMKKNCAEMKI